MQESVNKKESQGQKTIFDGKSADKWLSLGFRSQYNPADGACQVRRHPSRHAASPVLSIRKPRLRFEKE